MTERTARLSATLAPPWRAAAAAALIATLLAVVLAPGRGGGSSAQTPAAVDVTLSSLPSSAQESISAALASTAQAYRVGALGDSLFSANPAQHLRFSFTREGVRVGTGASALGLSVRGFGYGESLVQVGDVQPRASANRVLYDRAGLSEWYANGPLGLEQGFTVARAPVAPAVGPLTIAMALTGATHAALAENGRSVVIGDGAGRTLRYGDLSASDARGRTLHSWLALQGGHVVLRVDARGARYPLRIDPLFQQAKLTAGGEAGGEWLGYSVALSADAGTAVIGGPHARDEAGAAWVFTRSGTTWTQQAKLTEGEAGTGTGGAANTEEDEQGHLGVSVALSGDGNTVVIGSPGASGTVGAPGEEVVEVGRGAAWVFTRSGTTWTQGAELTGGGEEKGAGRFGRSVALSPDGGIAMVGAPRDAGGAGAAWAFIRSGAEWIRVEKLTGDGETGEGHFGGSVALSAQGETALVGGPGDGGYVGAAWAFARAGMAWKPQAKLVGGEAEHGEAGHFGRAVALSGDGTTALIGGPGDNTGSGAAWVFTRMGTAWAQQGPVLTGAGEIGEAAFGDSVALSSDGGTALVGGPEDKSGSSLGGAWEFARSGTSWAQQGERLKAFDASGRASFGYSVALSAAADFALVGGLRANRTGTGAAWAFGPTPLEHPGSEPPPQRPGGSTSSSALAGQGVLGSQTSSTGGAAATGVSLVSRTVTVQRNGTAAIRLACTRPGGCAGKLTLTSNRKSKRRTLRIVIGTAAFSIAHGTATVNVKLSKTGRAFLKAGRGRIDAILAILAPPPGASQAQTATIHLRLVKVVVKKAVPKSH